MDNDFIELSDDFTVIMPSPQSIPNFRSFFILPHKRRERKESTGYPVSSFKTVPPAEFICVICQNVVKKPIECRKCGKLYCENCANALKKTEDSNSRIFSCTICGCSQEPRQPSMVLLRMISELKMKCSNFDQGCHHYITIEDMSKHDLGCPYREVSCENRSFCKKTGLIKDFLENDPGTRSSYSHLPNRVSRHKTYTCSETCKKIVAFERLVNDKQYHKALLEYHNLVTRISKSEENI